MSDEIIITIDGKQCSCTKGEYLYDVAKRNGIGIPVLCRSNAFAEHRACCRICIVEVIDNGWSKVVTSCIYPVEKPIEVKTNSEKILRERSVIYGLLAARAPEASDIGIAAKFSGDVGKDRFVTVDGSKCILCGQCVQACTSLGTGAISTVNRGVEKMIDTPYSEASKDCVGCLSCANVCPTHCIEYTETETTRTIWNRDFDLIFCEKCGAKMGTREAYDHANANGHLEADAPLLCDACKKEAIADEMMKKFRNV